MNIKFHSTVLFVKDIEASKNFYCDILQLEIDTDFGNNVTLNAGISLWQVPDWHKINDDFYQRNKPNRALELYFETEDILGVTELVEKNRISQYQSMTEEEWGQKTIRMYDPDDNLVEIGESLETFIRRMYEEGLSAEDIHKKSGVQTELIHKFIAS